LQIRRNSVPVSAELSGTASPVDPGEVVVDASAPGRVPFSTKVRVAAKARMVVSIPALQATPESPEVPAPPLATRDERVPPAAVAPAAQAAAQPTAAPAAPPAVERASPIPWIVGGAGVVALGVGTYFGFRAISKANDAEEICPKGICDQAEGETAASDAHSAAKISNISFALGAAAVAAGVVLYFTLPTKHGTQVGMSPMLDPSSLGLSVRGRLEL